MLAFALAAYLLQRRVCVLSSLGFAGLLMLMIDPLLAVSLGFLLSFGSVAAIVLFGRYVQQWLTCLIPLRFRQRSKPLTSGLAIALVASTATLPLTLEAFGILPLIGPLANLLLGPALCTLLVLSLIAHFFLLVLPSFGTLLISVCLLYSELLGSTIKWVARISWSSIPSSGLSTFAICLFIASIIALWLCWPKPNRKTLLRALALLSCALLAFVAYGHVTAIIQRESVSKTVTVLDVGQGDALLVQDGGQTMLIDAGPSPTALRERLLEHKVRTIDILVLTHDHADHARGAQVLGTSYDIKEIVVAEGAQNSSVFRDLSQRINAPLVGALAGDIIVMGRLELRFIWPLAPVKDPSANESCLIKLIVDTSPDAVDASPLDIVLTSGDAEAPEVKRALSHPIAEKALQVNGKSQEVDVLKVPHHGSKNSIDEQLGKMLAGDGNGKAKDSSIADSDGTTNSRKSSGGGLFKQSNNSPKIAVISSGAGNSYGHPRPEPLEVIDRYFQKLYRTDIHGSVTIEL
jgi:competence protein ComEC